jgi:hypothetical protein
VPKGGERAHFIEAYAPFSNREVLLKTCLSRNLPYQQLSNLCRALNNRPVGAVIEKNVVINSEHLPGTFSVPAGHERVAAPFHDGDRSSALPCDVVHSRSLEQTVDRFRAAPRMISQAISETGRSA